MQGEEWKRRDESKRGQMGEESGQWGDRKVADIVSAGETEVARERGGERDNE